MGRRASGIERVTAELFSPEALFPLKSEPFLAGAGRFSIIAAQMLGLPMRAIRNSNDVFVFPGYPPSPFFSMTPERSVLYVHDLFLLTRREHLNAAAKYYMAPMFKIAIKRFKYFLTNSEDTARKLKLLCNPAALVMPYRPRARNVFDLEVGDRLHRPARPGKLKVVALGTIEPRKNFVAAADICAALADRFGVAVELHIIGRFGWGSDTKALADRANVILHGFLTDAQAREIINASDFYLCTSHEEGLCLPLLEMQYGGLAVVAPDDPVFREVLGLSGIFIEAGKPERSAELIAQALTRLDWRSLHASAAASNIERWSRLAESDRQGVLGFFEHLISNRDGASSAAGPSIRDIAIRSRSDSQGIK
jgi:glycosyltransferase involved in cell wall biosynthesis